MATLRFDVEIFIVRGIAPAGVEVVELENLDSLDRQLARVWQVPGAKGLDLPQLRGQSLLWPAPCCRVNSDRKRAVGNAFVAVQALSHRLRERCHQTTA